MNPMTQVESVLQMSEDVQRQLKEAIEIIQFRDRQISAALNGLEEIVEYANQNMNVEGSMFVSTLVDKAGKTIDTMRTIHKESLTRK